MRERKDDVDMAALGFGTQRGRPFDQALRLVGKRKRGRGRHPLRKLTWLARSWVTLPALTVTKEC